MKIQFNWVELEGFRSIILPLHFDLQRSGLNLIKGINGAGKTSIFEGLIWALYGENLKESNIDKLSTWSENRTSQWKGTRVTVCFTTSEDTYYIYRHLEYKGLTHDVRGENYLILSKGDDERGNEPKMIGDFRNKAEIQEEINRLLGVDSRTFLSSVLFGQRMAKLIQQDNKDKRELFETLFETEWVGAAKVKCDADIVIWGNELSKLSYDINKSLTEIEHLTDKLSTAKTVVDEWNVGRGLRLTEKNRLLKDYTTQLTGFNAELVSYQEAQDLIKYDAEAHSKLEEEFTAFEKQFNEANLAQVTYNSKLTAAQNLVATKKSEVTKLQTELDKLKAKHIEGKCPYCEQELREGNKLEINHTVEIISATGKVQNAEVLLKEAEKAFKALQKIKAPATPESITKEKETIEEQLTAIDAVLVEFTKYADFIKETTVDKSQAEKDIARVTKEIEDIKAEKPPVVDLKTIEQSIITEQNKLEALQQNKPKIEYKLEVARWWSSKALGAGGLKAFVFSAMLTTLNQCVKKYGDRLGASLEFSIDLTKASKPFTTICSLGDKLNKDYKDFSGGEKQKLDIALLFAMHDLISMNTDMNILIMDEVFEGLSEDGETAVFDLIRTKAEEGKSVYIITHSAVLDSLYANTIQFENKQGNTIILN